MSVGGPGRAPKVTHNRPQIMPDNLLPKDAELLSGEPPDHELIRGSVSATILWSGGPRVSRSPPRGAPPPSRPASGTLRHGRPIVVPKSFRTGGRRGEGKGGITEVREFIGSHPLLSGSLTTAALTGELFFGVKIFGCYLRADFGDFYGCMISGGPAGARLEAPVGGGRGGGPEATIVVWDGALISPLRR